MISIDIESKMEQTTQQLTASQIYYRKNRERILANQRNYYERNKEAKQSYQRGYKQWKKNQTEE